MPTTPELKITHIEQSQASKEVTANAAFDDLDQAVAAYAPIAIGGTGAYVLTTDESQNRMIELTGVLTGNRTFEVPTDDRVYTIFNNTTGAFTVEVKTTAGTGVIIDQGKHLRVYCDSTDVLPFSETLPHIVLIVSSSGGSATFDFDKSSVIRSTLTENITTLTLSNGKDGQRILLELRQDGTGGWAITWPASVRFGTDILSADFQPATAASKVSYLGLIYNAQDAKYDAVSIVKGF